MTEPTPSPEQIPCAAPRPLWRAMRAFICLLFDLFGDPGALAARGLIGLRDRALMLPWLRAGEAFLRRLVFIEALALPAPRVKGAAKRAPRERKRRLVHLYPDKPEDWPVSFRLFPPRRRRIPHASRASRVRGRPLDLPNFLRPAPNTESEFAHARAMALRLQHAQARRAKTVNTRAFGA